MARILCVDDETLVRELLRRALTTAGHEYLGVGHAAEGLHMLEEHEVDLIVSDYQLPTIDGMEFLEMLRRDGDMTPLIMISGHGDVPHALAAIRAGADDYIVKPIDAADILRRVELALARQALRRELAGLRDEVAETRGQSALVGKSPAMARTLDLIHVVARSRATVLIEGESGTGKELIARAVHEESDRRRSAFIKLNCAALPEGLIESALFGHEKGAFTGAIKRVEGAFERAHGGTLLLDEISELRVDLQAKLLRVLQEQEFERVGGSHPIQVDVRIIATTNRKLKADAESGRFRQDLYYRLSVVPIIAPPLRERLGDVPLLAYHFASRAAAEAGKSIDAITPEAVALLQQYSWPGNVRELQHAIERAVVLVVGGVLDVSAFGDIRAALWTGEDRRRGRESGAMRGASLTSADPRPAISLPTLSLEAAETALIAEALRVADNNRTHAAALLGIGVRGLHKKLNAPLAARPVGSAEAEG